MREPHDIDMNTYTKTLAKMAKLLYPEFSEAELKQSQLYTASLDYNLYYACITPTYQPPPDEIIAAMGDDFNHQKIIELMTGYAAFGERKKLFATMRLLGLLPHFDEVKTCRECGCSEHHACVNPDTKAACFWVEDNLCSTCALKLAWVA